MSDQEQDRVVGDGIIRRLMPLATTGGKNIGGKEARLLIQIGCDVIEYTAKAIFGESDPTAREALQEARTWADGNGNLQKLEDFREHLITWTDSFCPVDRSGSQTTDQDRARETCANAIATIVRACLHLDIEWTRLAREREDHDDYAPNAAASVLLVVCPIAARALMMFGGSGDWREIQTELNQIATTRLVA